MFHSATPNYLQGHIRQMVLYDVCKKSVNERAYRHYSRGPQASPPPSIRNLPPDKVVGGTAEERAMAGMEIGPAVPNAEPRPEGGGLWDDWSQAVRAADEGLPEEALASVAARL